MKVQIENSVGAYHAKTHFSELLERVAQGEEIIITRHGVPLARLGPLRKSTYEARLQAIETMRQVAARNNLGGLDINQLKSEGRK